MNQSDEIKSRLDIVDIIRDYIQLRAAGMNFRANCPFHHEKTPSFMVSPDKQIWHCFGCGKGGDVITFIMEIEGLSFIEALRVLAPKAGIVLQKQDPKITSQRNRLIDIIEISKKYYHKILMESKEAEGVRKYLLDRGLKDETLDEWEIGYSPNSWDDLINLLKQKGFNDNEIFLSGMSVKQENANRFYNRFRGRIMFPINDVNAITVAFSARVNPANEADEKMGKYINSPQTMVYDKSKILFGLDKAKMHMKNENLAIISEGQMDVVTAHQAGFKNIVASSGTALTHEQILLISRYSKNIAFAFDMDKAGEMASDRGIKEAMSADMNIKVIAIPSGKDPDECIRQNPEEWKTSVAKAKLVMEYYFDKVFSRTNIDNIEGKRKAASELLTIISRIESNIEQDHWLRELAGRLDVDDKLLRETLTTNSKKTPANKANQSGNNILSKRKSREEMLSEYLIAILIRNPFLIEYAESHLSLDQMEGEGAKSIYKNLLIYYNNFTTLNEPTSDTQITYFGFKDWIINQDLDQKNISKKFDDYSVTSNDQLKLLDQLVILGDRDYYDFDNDAAKKETVNIILAIKEIYYSKRKKEIEKLISQAEKEGDKEAVNGLIEESQILSEELKRLQR
jgi:DNA primase